MYRVSQLRQFLHFGVMGNVKLIFSEYAGLLGRACPAAVYEYADAEGGDADANGKKFVINSQNCIHVS